MRIKTKLNISAAIPILLVSMLVIVLVFLSISVERQLKMSELSSKLAKATAELTLITQEYTIYHEDRMAQQWLSRFNSITKILQEKELSSLRKLSTNVETLNFSFNQLQENNAKFKALSKMELSSEVKNSLEFWEQRLEAQIRLHAQEILESTFRLSSKAREQAIAIQEKSRLLIGSIVIVVILIIAISTYIIIRSISKPLKQLGESVNQIGAGDLEKTVPILGKDEFGSLAMNFEDMRLKLKNAVSTIKESEERYAMAQISANIGSWDWNILSGDLQWSEQIEPIFGFKEGEFQRTYDAFMKCVHPDDREHVTSSVQKSLDDPEVVYDIEHRIVWPSGEVHWVSEKGKVYRDDKGVPIRMLGVVQDITTRKKAEMELEAYRGHLEELVEERTDELDKARSIAESANKAKSIFLANMSHELRTPLNAILGFSQIMSNDKELSSSQVRNLDIINKSGTHLLQLINDVLDMSKIEAGKTTLELDILDLGNLTNDIVDMMRVRAEAKGLKLILDQTSDFPRFIRGDAAKIRQIIINLLSNAIKFTTEGGVSLKLDAKNGEDESIVLRGEVQDSGIGIQKEDIEKIFLPFEQHVESAEQKGTGLGLAITKQFIELMGGEISVQSKYGKGTTFYFHIKVEKAPETEIVPKLEMDETRNVVRLKDTSKEWRILIAEDQLDNQLLLAQLLEDVGFTVKIASNGQEAVEVFKEWKPHFIWMDRRMPVMDGLEATKQIKGLPNGDQSVIAALTASVFKEQKNELLEAGCDDYVRKPYRPNEIYECMAKHLDIDYIYEEAVVEEATVVISSEDTKEAIKKLDKSIIRRIKEAANECSGEKLIYIANELEESNSDLAASLKHKAENFDFHIIIDIIEEISAKE